MTNITSITPPKADYSTEMNDNIDQSQLDGGIMHAVNVMNQTMFKEMKDHDRKSISRAVVISAPFLNWMVSNAPIDTLSHLVKVRVLAAKCSHVRYVIELYSTEYTSPIASITVTSSLRMDYPPLSDELSPRDTNVYNDISDPTLHDLAMRVLSHVVESPVIGRPVVTATPNPLPGTSNITYTNLAIPAKYIIEVTLTLPNDTKVEYQVV